MAAFPVTRYSIVAAIRSERTDVRRSAFDTLVTAYWKPVFKYVRLKWGASPDEAADLTQGFFLRAFEKDFFAGFDASRARFRTYLRVCLDGHVANARKADARLKRGGGATLISIDVGEAERELRHQAANAVDDFDAYFHREWLRSLFAAAAERGSSTWRAIPSSTARSPSGSSSHRLTMRTKRGSSPASSIRASFRSTTSVSCPTAGCSMR